MIRVPLNGVFVKNTYAVSEQAQKKTTRILLPLNYKHEIS